MGRALGQQQQQARLQVVPGQRAVACRSPWLDAHAVAFPVRSGTPGAGARLGLRRRRLAPALVVALAGDRVDQVGEGGGQLGLALGQARSESAYQSPSRTSEPSSTSRSR